MTIPDEDRQVLTGHDVAAELLEDWRFVLGALHARFRTGDFATGARLVQWIAEAADDVDHHPDVDLRYPHVDVRLVSHDVDGVTQRDVRLAREITRLASGVAKAAPDEVVAVEWALDTPDHAEVKDFWAAVLGLAGHQPDDLVDTGGRWPSVWFQESERPEDGAAPVQRWHVDVHVAPDQAERRIRAALEAGGTMVDEGWAPSFWVLADAQGNRACVCTWLGRDGGPDSD
ncbi:Putative pterin-4-alpha-carbinolamine dehydratase [Nocardioides dokdonensis FR1436]|uniref:Putative pterin-4-alpha-carbinolamine dehydratase n=1 Tax=Nocardioides dokdonensis FR1436 TaxID=1300347 RepID=A0A1A9GN32_9ACTN|nr:4a-hydroxytetrahydrobiopterin dehydratase [Nocardioides dokdonensis]ANH38865.1 Putative pterin-4-alpha-carbinolamine dehydratase [Nocardioides dokdonensis FR1436]